MTMDANDEKIRTVVLFGDKLSADGHYAADKIHKKSRNIQERRETNRERANALRANLHDAVGLQKFLSDCEELREFIEDRLVSLEAVGQRLHRPRAFRFALKTRPTETQKRSRKSSRDTKSLRQNSKPTKSAYAICNTPRYG